jgi:hypothetical protein
VGVLGVTRGSRVKNETYVGIGERNESFNRDKRPTGNGTLR